MTDEIGIVLAGTDRLTLVEAALVEDYGFDAEGCITEGRLPIFLLVSPNGVSGEMDLKKLPRNHIDADVFLEHARTLHGTAKEGNTFSSIYSRLSIGLCSKRC